MGGQVGETNRLIYFYYFSKSIFGFIFFDGGAGRSNGYFYLFRLSCKKLSIGHLWFQLFLGGGRDDVSQRNIYFDCL